MRRFVDVAGGVAYRGLKKIATNPQLLLPSLIFPLFFFVAFAGGLSSVGDVPGFDFPSGYTAFQFVFVLLQASAFGGVFTGFGIASDFENGFAQRLMLAAPNRLGILAGYALSAIVRAVLVGVLLFVVAADLHPAQGGDGVDVFALIILALIVNLTAAMWSAGVAMRLRTIQAGPVMQMPVFLVLFFAPVYVPLALLVNFIAAMWAAGIAMRLRTIQAGPLMQMPVFIILFLAPVYVPLSLLSGWIHAVARFNPFTALIEGGRDLISGQTFDPALVYGVAAVLLAVFVVWAVTGLRRAEAAG